jgi:glutaredoxin
VVITTLYNSQLLALVLHCTGRITIFSLPDCPHCQRTKSALTVRQIPYTEINLSIHPSARTFMLQLADRLSVPQVFFNERHIGGADETIAVLEEWDKDGTTTEYQSALERYTSEIASQPDPTDPRLQVPTTPPVMESSLDLSNHRSQSNKKVITLPDGTTTATVLEITEQLKQNLPCHQNLKHMFTVYKRSFTGQQAVGALQAHYHNITREQAIDFFETQLLARTILRHVCDDGQKKCHKHDLNNTYYRLQCHHTPSVLNSYRVWTTEQPTTTTATAVVDDSDQQYAMALVQRWKRLLGAIESAVTDAVTATVDYKKAVEVPEYAVFEEAVCELQQVNMLAMDDNTRTAFAINVYNLMIKYAFMKVGIGTTNLARASFFSQCQMNIGGHLFTFNDLENGVLRGNRKPPYAWSVPFGKHDFRLPLAMANPDCRIHFALNCGAKSCPPVKFFTAQAIQEELRIVALAFCEQDENVRVDTPSNTLYLSTILYWYRVDFAPSTAKQLPGTVLQFLRGDKHKALQTMIDSNKSVTVKFLDYDWSTNASNFVAFTSSTLSPNETGLFKGLFG